MGDENHADSEPVCVTVVIAEKIEFTVIFKVVNGSWDDGSRDEKTVVLSGTAGEELKLTEEDIPSVGSKPDTGYQAGSWDEEPTAGMKITESKTFLYTYAEKQVDPMPLNVEIHNYTNTGANGVPGDVPRTEFKVTVEIVDKESGEVVSTAADVAFEVMGGPNSAKVSLENVEFDQKVSDLSEAKYQVVVTGFPAKVTGVAPMSQEYALSYTAWPGGSKLLTIYLKWDDGKRSEPERIKVYALPEDEIGAYTIRKDGTKEYLIFHTYDICMRWLGSDELCRGYERCFHKENAYINPFVTATGVIGENLN